MIGTPNTGMAVFVAELVKAANGSAKMTEDEARRLLGRAYVTIVEAREQLSTHRDQPTASTAISLASATGLVGALSDQDVRALLLDAAEMIRTMKILLDREADT
ncbi:hypothetical protein GB927_007685 [Shinella sp. CPCC 100929]|uniref:Uncharacterized protein n=2 Tax=Rhizobiaceae TaxID=82115 RepID=A0ABT1R3Z1_9HYPH|nr:hypothetical protein [Shinella lacus]